MEINVYSAVIRIDRMYKCPNCQTTFKRFVFEGWVTYARGSAEVDAEGLVKRVGPLLVKQTVAPGKEVDGNEVYIQCPDCKSSLKRESYIVVRSCMLYNDAEAGHLVHFDAGTLINDVGFTVELHLSNAGLADIEKLARFDPAKYVRG